MRRSTRSVIVVLALGLAAAAPAPTRADIEPSRQWQDLLAEARRAKSQNDWDGAHAAYDRAAAIAEESFGASDERLARTLEEIARAWSFQRNKPRAVEAQTRAVELRLAMGEPASRPAATAQALAELGKIYKQFGDNEQAEGYLRRALALREQALGDDHATVGDLRRELSEAIAAARPDDEEGAELLRRNLAVDDTPDHRADLAFYLAERGDHPAAVDELLRAVALEEGRPMPRPGELVSLWTRLGDEYLSLERYADAESALLQALELREQQLGPNHPNLAFTLKKLAVIYIETERFVEAEAQLLRARELNEAAWGKGGHPCGCNTDALMAQLGEALGRADGRQAEADAPAVRAETRQEKGADDPRRAELSDLERRAGELRDRGEIEDAKATAREALALRDEIWGADSMEAAIGLGRLALLLRDERRYDEAAELWARRLTLLESRLEPRDEVLVESLGTMGLLARMAFDYDDAESFYRRELRARNDLGQNVKVARILEALGNMNLLRAAPERAERDLAEAAERWEAMAGAEAPEIVRLRSLLARAWIDQGRTDEAIDELSSLIEREGAKRYPDANLLWQALLPLKTAYEAAGRPDEAQAVQARLDELQALKEAVRADDERLREPASRVAR